MKRKFRINAKQMFLAVEILRAFDFQDDERSESSSITTSLLTVCSNVTISDVQKLLAPLYQDRK